MVSGEGISEPAEEEDEGEEEEAEPIVDKPPPTKRFRPVNIERMNFVVKTEDDPVDERGMSKYEQCFICKWFIEKGNYYLELGCKHRFHKKCMEVQLLTSSRCAICKVEANLTDLFPASAFASDPVNDKKEKAKEVVA